MNAAGPAHMSSLPPHESGALNVAPAGAERGLADTLDRALRHPADKVALVLHLSRLSPPAPQPHHLRVVQGLMQDCAQRFNGQVFSLPGQDMVLVATMPRNTAAPDLAASPLQLRATLNALFAADLPGPLDLTSFWRLDEDPRGFGSYLGRASHAASNAPRPVPPPAEIPASARCLLTLEEITAQAPLADLIVRQTGMFLAPDRKQRLDQRLTPAFRELRVAVRLLNLRPPASEALADPYLRQHFQARLDAQLLPVLQEDLRVQGRLCRAAMDGGLPVHVTLGLEAIQSPGFARITRLARESGVRLAIQISLMQASLGIDQLAQVRKLLELGGFELTIGPVNAVELGIAAPGKLASHAIRLVWSQHLADAVADKQSAVARNFGLIPPAKIILHAVDSDQGVVWGQAQGIGRYQGKYIDLVQAATRMAGCAAAANCTMRQCADRAGSLSKAGRSGCLNQALLDAPALKTS